MKTTNAKAKAFQTPAAAAIGGQIGNINQRSVSVQKPKPKVSHPETTKLEDILADKEALDEREIEYMPPKAKGIVLGNGLEALLRNTRSTGLPR